MELFTSNYLTWVLLALLTGTASAAINHQSPKHRGLRNSALAGLFLLAGFLAVDYALLSGDWWTLSSSSTLMVLGLALIFGLINIGLNLWAQGGSDYSRMAAAGMVSDGCFHKEGTLQIPKNILSNGSMALGEEVLFRGFLGILLFQWFGPWVAIVVTALLFGALHYALTRRMALDGGVQPGRYVISTLLITTITPAFFMAAVIYFESLVPGWLLHWGVNCTVGAYMRYARKTPQGVEVAPA